MAFFLTLIKKVINYPHVFLILLLILCTIPLTSCQSNFCQTLDGTEICITQIKRSAKNYWEYRAAARIDGQKTPLEVYDCRNKIRITQEGQFKPFQSPGVGELICSFFNS